MDLERPVVLALPRGGVPVAAEVARALGAPLEVLVARKLGAPHQPELGIGALAEGGVRVVDPAAVRALHLAPADVEAVATREAAELDRRVHRYRGDRPLPDLAGRTAVVVDDGLATGVTASAALRAAVAAGPARLVLAVPVGSPDTATRLAAEHGVEVVCLEQPWDLRSVGRWYRDFAQTTDDEVLALLAAGRAAGGS
jgi:predicted phosphoribosyltransferase